MSQWKTAGKMNPRVVQQLEPTRAMSVEKLGIARTMRAEMNTSSVLSKHCEEREYGIESGRFVSE